MQDAHDVYFRTLSREEQHLLALKELLYEGSWEEIVLDLRARKAGKPHVFKLETRIDEDLLRIEKLRSYEADCGVNLAKYLPRESLPGTGTASN
jgi:hypothetical protein